MDNLLGLFLRRAQPQMWYDWVPQTHKWPSGLHHGNKINSAGDTYHVAVFLPKLFGEKNRWHEKTQLSGWGPNERRCQGEPEVPWTRPWPWLWGTATGQRRRNWSSGGKLELVAQKDDMKIWRKWGAHHVSFIQGTLFCCDKLKAAKLLQNIQQTKSFIAIFFFLTRTNLALSVTVELKLFPTMFFFLMSCFQKVPGR